LSAVFVPCAFISGITGRFFQQFAVTIAASTIISAVNALTMTPSRALLIFRGHEAKPAAAASTAIQPGAPGPGPHKPDAPAHKAGHGHGPHPHAKEALPWWIFGLVGGLLTASLGPTTWPLSELHWPAADANAAEGVSSSFFSLRSAVLFAPGL